MPSLRQFCSSQCCCFFDDFAFYVVHLVKQYAEICLFTKANYKCTVAQLDTEYELVFGCCEILFEMKTTYSFDDLFVAKVFR